MVLIYSKEKIVAHQKCKSSLILAETNLEGLNKVTQNLTSISNYNKSINESEKYLKANGIIYYLVAIILCHLPAGFRKNVESQYHGIVEEYINRSNFVILLTKRAHQKEIFPLLSGCVKIWKKFSCHI